MPYSNTLQYQAGVEPLPLPLVDVLNSVQWGNVNYQPRIAKRKRPVEEGMSTFPVHAAIDLVASEYEWRGAHADLVARRKRSNVEALSHSAVVPFTAADAEVAGRRWFGAWPDRIPRGKRAVGEGLQETDNTEALAVPPETITSDKWTGDYQPSIARRKRPLDEGLLAFEPQRAIDGAVTFNWRPAYPDAVIRRQRWGEGLLGTDYFEATTAAELVTLDKWIGEYPPAIPPRRSAPPSLWYAFGQFADLATRTEWLPTYPDTIAKRERAIGLYGPAAFFTQLLDPSTIDRWAPTYPDRTERRKPLPHPEFVAWYPETPADVVVVPPVTTTRGRLPLLVQLQKPGLSAIDLLKPEQWELGPVEVIDLRPAIYALLTIRLAPRSVDAHTSTQSSAHARLRISARPALASTEAQAQAEGYAFDGYREQQDIIRRIAALESAQPDDDAEALGLLGVP